MDIIELFEEYIKYMNICFIKMDFNFYYEVNYYYSYATDIMKRLKSAGYRLDFLFEKKKIKVTLYKGKKEYISEGIINI